MLKPDSWFARTVSRLEARVYRGGWPVRIARACGVRPSVKITRVDVRLGPEARLPRGLRLAYASDFHVGPTTDPAVLRSACEQLRNIRPDVLLLGGDFVTSEPAEVDWLAVELGAIPAPFGRYAVLGNHDWWGDPSRITRRLEEAGIQVLTNRNIRLAPPFSDVWVCGVDDHWCGSPDAERAFAGAEGVRILLMHSPSGLLDVAGSRFDLALSGHTHGGQVALPGGIPIVVPHGRLSRRYARGRYTLAPGRTLVVSVGVGCVVFPLRMYADPEVLACDLTSAGVAENSPKPTQPFSEVEIDGGRDPAH